MRRKPFPELKHSARWPFEVFKETWLDSDGANKFAELSSLCMLVTMPSTKSVLSNHVPTIHNVENRSEGSS